MTPPAFILSWDTSLVGDEGVTAELVPFKGSADIIGWKILQPIEVPERIFFEANIETVRQVDYPDNDVRWPIMSERMRDILLPHASKHRVIPVIMLDDTVPTAKRLQNGIPRPGVAVEGFAAVQLLERIDAMDMDRSTFTPDEDFPGRARDIQKLVFKDTTLPSLFRLSAYPSPLFVSAAARAELDAAGIKGVSYMPIEKIAFM